MDKTNSPESLLWVISVVPKIIKICFIKAMLHFFLYILLFTGQGYVCEEETSAREKNQPPTHPAITCNSKSLNKKTTKRKA